MTQVYKWAIAALTGCALFFGERYIDGIQQQEALHTTQLLNHEQRITTMEESKRYQEQLLKDIKQATQDIQSALIERANRPTPRQTY